MTALVAVTACNGTENGGSADSGGSGTIKVGFINQTAGSVGTYPEVQAAFEATVQYINEELDGVGGKKIELDSCAVDGTPTSSQRCAQQMVTNKPAFVFLGNDYNSGVTYPILDGAGLMVIGEVPLSLPDFNAPNVAFFNSGTAGSGPVIPAYLKLHPTQNKSFGALVSQNPAALAAATLLEVPLEQAGYSFQQTAVSPTATDYSSSLLSINPAQLGGLTGILASNGCVAFANAYGQQNLNTPVIANQTCYAPDVLAAAGENMVGWKVTQLTADPMGETEDAVLYRKIMSTYAKGTEPGAGQAALAFSTVMTTYNNILKPMGSSEVTSKAVKDALAGPAKTGKVALGGNYECGGTVAALPTVCGWGIYMYEIGPGPDFAQQVIPDQVDPIDVSATVAEAFPNGLPS
ncbi:ABC transporter substrate-binding protein [Gordonia mangrovi]|uniref:ABC transporter substrate-binding protein n=1 Tax=Gordonia mangrovi TaxID=2665643 RepID=UPI00136DEED8|nr:ABC transporter substrate-binding protein [Gordonia mangrovi]UVF76940.1 ABC transporter substrate-binding protein [Gordonia mangrovi]